MVNRLVKHGGLTRQALQTAIGVSSPTMTRAIAELAETGLVVVNSGTAAGKGRPAETIDLAPDGLCSIGLSVHADTTTARLLDAGGNAVRRLDLPLTKDSPYAEAVATMGDAAMALASEAASRFAALAGIGISFFGAADYAAGAIADASAFPTWHYKPLARDIAVYTGLPAAIENYSVALASAVNWFDPEEPADFFLVIADYGIGGVSSIGGAPLRGASRRPAGFGHIGSLSHGERRCHCGGFDCLTTTASVRAIREDALDAGLIDGLRPDLGAMVAELDGSTEPQAKILLAAAGIRLAGAALNLSRGMGFPVCMLGGALFDHSAHARQAARAVFEEPGHECRARFLGEVFAGRSTDDLAAAAIAYHHLSRTRQAYPLHDRQELDKVLARRAR